MFAPPVSFPDSMAESAEDELLVPGQETISAKRCGSPFIWALVGSNLLLLGEETLLLFFSSHSVVLGGFELGTGKKERVDIC